MSDTADQFPIPALSPRTHMLATSPPLIGFRQLAYRFIARGLDDEAGAVIITTDQDARSVIERLDTLTDGDGLDTLGVVDATSQDPPDDLPCPVETVGSPADLTGMGIGLTKLLERLHSAGITGYRVLFDSVSSLLVYTGFRRVYRFLHALTNRIDQVDGTSLSLLSADTDQQELGKLEGLYDGIIEVRQTDETIEYRVSGFDGPAEWRSLPQELLSRSGTAQPAPATSTEPTAATEEPPIERLSPTSLKELIDQVNATGLTLTLCNYRDGEEILTALTDYFKRFNVTVRTASLSTDTPTNVGLLHQNTDILATSPVSELHNAIELEIIEASEDVTAMVQPEVIEQVQRNEFTVENGGKLDMVRISRLVETRALEMGKGTLHTGFQRLNRVRDELGTQEIYENIAQTDVSVHLYGQPGDVPNEDWYTIHTADEGELAESWFVVYDGADHPARKAALVSRETNPQRYSGFWTYQSGLVDAVTEYLETTYGDA